MKGYEHLADTIEAYVAKKLSKQESEAFEQRMLVDEGLNEAVAMEQSLSSLVLENDLLQLNKRMTADLASSEKKTKVRRISFSLLALVTLSAGLVYFIAISEKEKTASSLKYKWQQEEEKPLLPKSKEEISKLPTSSLKPQSTRDETKGAPLALQNVPSVSGPVAIAPIETEKKTVIQVSQALEPESKIPLLESASAVAPCADKKIEATLVSKACQKNQVNGSIEIQLTSSRPHIQFSLDKHQFTENMNFKHLSAGEHTVYAQEDGCITSLGKVIIKSTVCISEYEKTYSPDIDIAWPIPIMEGETASFKIVDKAGNVVLESREGEASGVTWSGSTSNGGPAALGVYKVFIQYPSGESCVSSVTLFR